MRLATLTLSSILLTQSKLPQGALPSQSDAIKPPIHALPSKASKDTLSRTTASDQKSQNPQSGLPRRNCLLDLADPPGSEAAFSADGNNLWLLTVSHGAAKSPPNKLRYILYKIFFSDKRSEPIMSLQHGPNAVLLPYGDPPEAVTLLSFTGNNPACFQGPASLVSMNLGSKGGNPFEHKGNFQLIATPSGMTLADLAKSQILEIDPKSFQTKNVRKIANFERPLYFDPASKKMISWYDDGQKRGLVIYPSADDRDAKRLEFKRDDIVLQQGGSFAVAHQDHAQNTIDIRELKDWTGTTNPGQFKLKLPVTYQVKNAGINIHFRQRLALVQGNNDLAKMRWRRLFIYHYPSSEPRATLTVSAHQYIHFAAIEPTGLYALIEIRNQKSRQTESVRIYEVAANRFMEIPLTQPK